MLVSVADLTKYMDIRFSNRQEEAAEFVLEGLQSELEGYLRRPIEPTEFTETYIMDSNYVGVPTSSFFYNESLDTTFNSHPLYATYDRLCAKLTNHRSGIGSHPSTDGLCW